MASAEPIPKCQTEKLECNCRGAKLGGGFGSDSGTLVIEKILFQSALSRVSNVRNCTKKLELEGWKEPAKVKRNTREWSGKGGRYK